MRAFSRRAWLAAAFPFRFPLEWDEAAVTRSEARSAEGFTETLAPGVALEMIAIPPGRLTGAQGRETLVGAFALGRYEVTIAQWNAVARYPKKKRALPVLETGKKSVYAWEPGQAAEMVSFADATEFCARLSARTRRLYRLPTDREWEYACRAGTGTRFWWGDRFTRALAVAPEENEPPKPPGSLGFANAFGLFDMVGNVDEWVLDEESPRTDFHAYRITAAERDWLAQKFTRTALGFRVAAEESR